VGVTVEQVVEGVVRLRPVPSVVVATMSAVAPFAADGPPPGGFAYLPSSMGQAVPFALGIALRRPALPVVVLAGDGSMLMNLGCLATVAEAEAPNLRIVVLDNGVYQVTGGQPVVGSGRVRFEAVAHACGLRHAEAVGEPPALDGALGRLFGAAGPALLSVRVDPVPDAPPARSPGPPVERLARLRAFLAGAGDGGVR